MDTLEDMIEFLKPFIKSKKLENALREVPREHFVPEKYREDAYNIDHALPIGHGQTISQPSVVVIMTETLDVKEGQKILEIGAGSGYQAAILGKLVGKGKVYTIDRIEELVKISKANIKKVGVTNVKVYKGDGSLGLEKYAPYDRIIVTAACPYISEALKDQLKVGGKLIAPIGNKNLQEMILLTKTKEGFEKKKIGMFCFVPLIGKKAFES